MEEERILEQPELKSPDEIMLDKMLMAMEYLSDQLGAVHKALADSNDKLYLLNIKVEALEKQLAMVDSGTAYLLSKDAELARKKTELEIGT
jgi:archaellum component FlaC